MSLQSPALSAVPHILHGFGNAAEPVPREIEAYWQKKPSWHQVHGDRSVEILFPGQEAGDCDGLYSAAPGVPVAIQTADCVPILLARADGQAVAAVHAGWRGTRARILRKLWDTLMAQGESPARWVAAIGPAIGPCCYEVSQELADDFAREFASFGESLVVPRENHLDLQAINEAELRSIGLEKVDLLRSCTFCGKSADGTHLHRSFRREKTSVRQWSGLVIAPARVIFKTDNGS